MKSIIHLGHILRGALPRTDFSGPTDPAWTIEAAVDWDQDGDLDLVWRNLSTGRNTVWLMTGAFWSGAFTDLTPFNDPNWRIEDF